MCPAAYEEGWPSEKVSGLRYRLGASQQQMAQLLGVRQQTVSDWETGLHEPQGASRRMLSIIAEDPARYTTARDREQRPTERRTGLHERTFSRERTFSHERAGRRPPAQARAVLDRSQEAARPERRP